MNIRKRADSERVSKLKAHTFIHPQYSCSSDFENSGASVHGWECNNILLKILGVDGVGVQPFIFGKSNISQITFSRL